MKFLGLLLLVAVVQCQFFDSKVDDKTYLDRIEEKIQSEVESSALELIHRAKDAEKVTKSYISVKLKDNVFKALRTLAETEAISELETFHTRSRVGRQESSEGSSSKETEGGGGSEAVESEGGGDDDVTEKPEATEKPTTPLNGLSTAVKINQNVFQFIGEAIKTIFNGVGGGKRVREEINSLANEDPSNTKLVEALPQLMKKPYADQLMGIIEILKKSQLTNNDSNKKGLLNPIETLFGNRGKVSRKANQDETVVFEYIEELKQKHPLLLPDLYRGIPEAHQLLESMNKVVTGIHRDEIQS